MSKKLQELSMLEQKELLVCYDGANLEYISKHRAAQILNVSRGTLNALLRNRKTIENYRGPNADEPPPSTYAAGPSAPVNSGRSMTLDDVEKCLFKFYTQTLKSKSPVTDDVLLAKAKVIATRFELNNFIPTNTWLIYWKYKNNIPIAPISDRRRIADFGQAANEKWLKDLVHYTLSNYVCDDVYGLIETGLYYPPTTTMNATGVDSGHEQRAQRLSVIFLCNMTGTDKKRPLVIDKNHTVQNAGFNALTTNHYMSFLKKWNQEVAPKRILLILDNRSVHPTIELRNIEIKYLPKNVVHPLGEHIVRVAKTFEDRNYATSQPSPGAVTTVHDSWDFTVSEYVNTLLTTWDRISSTNIRDCFRTIGFVTEQRADNCRWRPNNGGATMSYREQSVIVSHKTDRPPLQTEQTLPLNLCKKDVQLRSANNGGSDDDDNIPRTVTNMGDNNNT